MDVSEIIQLIISVATLVGLVIGFYKYFRDPDVKAQEEIKLIKQGCLLRHETIDKNIVLIKENHLKHVEKSISNMQGDIKGILAVLEFLKTNKK